MSRAVLFLILLAAPVLAQTPTPEPQPVRHLDYSKEHFSLDVPSAWPELDSAAVAALSTLTTKLLPDLQNVKLIHAYTPSGTVFPPYPGAMVLQIPARPSLTAFRASFTNQTTVNDAFAKVAGATSGIFTGSLNTTSYDSDRHMVRADVRSSNPLTGDLLVRTAIFLTRSNTLQVQCIAKASEAEQYQAVCNHILDSFAVDAQASIPQPAPLDRLLHMSTQEADATYRDLVARAKGGDLSVDFRTMRFACAKSSLCEVRATPERLAAMNQAENEYHPAEAVKLAEAMIDRGFINLEVHASAAGMYKELNQPDQAKLHFDLATELMLSIMDTADGKSEQSAFEVISVREIYGMLAALGLPYFGGGVQPGHNYASGGHQYQRWNIIDPKTDRESSVFFLVDALDIPKP